MCNYFRTLRADEIEVRVQQVKRSANGKVYAQMLLYKDARVDMILLDEKFGIFGWQREHSFKDGRCYCKVSVFDEKRNAWISKEDAGAEADIEKEKSSASSSFKRACVNLGIGRELYSSPRIVVELANGEYYESQDARGNKVQRLSTKLNFSVKAIDYDEKRSIVAVEIVDNSGRTRAKIGVIHEALFTAKAEANNAKTVTEAHNVWKKYPEFHDDPGFRVACKAKADFFADELLSKTQQTA